MCAQALKNPSLALGGQALIEGVMIRTPTHVTVAVRKPKGDIIVKKEVFHSLTTKGKVFKLPIIRGVINLFEMIIVGTKALDFSVQESLSDEPTGSKKTTRKERFFAAVSFFISIVISLAFAVFLFKFVPLFLTEQLQKLYPRIKESVLLFNVIDGVLRILIFFLYIGILSLFPSFRRVFEYHGAEHKTVFAHEKNLPLTEGNVKRESPRHPRCGTSFLIIVLIISILLFSFVPRHPVFWITFLRRLSIIPLIAGVAYEILKWTAKYERHPIVKILVFPGILTQYITTKEPDSKQIEVAIAAVKAATASSASFPLTPSSPSSNLPSARS